MSRYAEEIMGRGRTVGLFLTLASPIVTEIAANSGFDWLILDAEHGPYEPSSILPLLQAIAPYGCEPIVRLPSDSPVAIKRYLDLGLRMILVPMVESAAQAAAVVAATRYPPQGIRGVGAGLARASRWGANRTYLNSANDSVTIIVQVESLAGLNALDEILAVDGVDGVFIGPADLAASMDLLGQATHPEVRARCDAAITRIVRARKIAGYYAATHEIADAVLALGAQFVAVGADSAIFARSAETLADRFAGRHRA